MARAGAYPIEDFLEAITAQLDQTQDALRLKAVNRPLTFALKEFNVDLKVFVEMDAEGRVTFRPAQPNEAGASTVQVSFTTITRPMIEENTISMEMAQAPNLDELGLGEPDRRQLAKIGVRNAAQLRKLQRDAGEDTLSRHTGVDLGRLRAALDLARPRVDAVTAQPPPTTAAPGRIGAGIDAGAIAPRAPRAPAAPIQEHPEARDVGATGTGPGGIDDLGARIRRGVGGAGAPQVRPPNPARRVTVAPGASSIRLEGHNLLDGGVQPVARLSGRSLGLIQARGDSVSFALPSEAHEGLLELELPDGTVECFDLVREPGWTR